MSQTYKCLILAGCTAVGKSAMAMRIARQRPIEIISADSVAVYQGLDLGSAKPSRLSRRLVHHHLLDVADPAASLSNPYTAVQFARDACQAIRDVSERGHLPVVCGGSGMYLSFLLHGHDRYDPNRLRPSRSTCDTVDQALASCPDWSAAVLRIANRLDLDPIALQRVQLGNRRRLLGTIQRLLHDQTDDGYGDPVSPADDIDFRPFVLARPRLLLYRAIDLRCERMVQHGLLDEVLDLSRSGRLQPGSPPALAVGYRQALAYLDELRQAQGQFDLGAFRRFLDAFQTASRQLARRQLTWFRQDPLWRWVDADAEPDPIPWLLGQFDLDRPAWSAALQAELTNPSTARLRHLSDSDRRQQRRYVPESVIFKAGLDSDIILRLISHDVKSAIIAR